MSVAMLDALYPALRVMASAADMVPMVWWMPLVLCFTLVGMISSCVNSLRVMWSIAKVVWRLMCAAVQVFAVHLNLHHDVAARLHDD